MCGLGFFVQSLMTRDWINVGVSWNFKGKFIGVLGIILKPGSRAIKWYLAHR